MFRNFSDGVDFLRAAVYPDRCALCDDVIEYRSKVCMNCRTNVDVIRGDRCRHCGFPLKECNCKGRSTFYGGITAPFRYEGTVRGSIHRWKYSDDAHSTDFFAEMTAAAVRESFSDIDFDFVTFVPQTADEKAERGYNQGEKLACSVAQRLDLSVENVLFKLFGTERQHDLDFRLKSGNVFGVFDCTDTDMIKNKKILIVDDVKTSGRTLNECAKMLRLYDAAEVYCAVIAVTVQQKGKKHVVEDN